ncbi:hypothetical protein Bca52824_011027 [Brassica carinata]|uniref:ABC transporter domain-containing protein n=1 Tax=Brassica carinata TaxID=52824 RepID=A0A8X8B861_BRACI|nr:hypothetical protein Bca52824_011027 [Brassica carinata]
MGKKNQFKAAKKFIDESVIFCRSFSLNGRRKSTAPSLCRSFVSIIFSSPPPPYHRVRLGIAPSRVLFCNLRANSTASPALRKTHRSNTVFASSVCSSISSDSVVGDGDGVGRRMPLLEVKDLRAVIVKSRQEILKGVNLVVYEGEIHAVMGKNGSGKSTFL